VPPANTKLGPDSARLPAGRALVDIARLRATYSQPTIGACYQLIGTYKASLSASSESLVVYGDKSRGSRKEAELSTKQKTVIVTGASQGIGASVVPAFNTGIFFADAVVYLTGARQVTGEVLHVDGGAHSSKW
jgi:hypothetical protein